MNEKKFIQEIISNELDYCFRDCSQDNIDKWVEILNRYKKQLLLHNVSQQRELLFCGGCGNKKQLIVETDINSQKVCKNKLCKQNNCG